MTVECVPAVRCSTAGAHRPGLMSWQANPAALQGLATQVVAPNHLPAGGTRK